MYQLPNQGLVCFVSYGCFFVSFLFLVYVVFCFIVVGCQYKCSRLPLSEMTCYMSSGTLNPTHSLTHSLIRFMFAKWCCTIGRIFFVLDQTFMLPCRKVVEAYDLVRESSEARQRRLASTQRTEQHCDIC